MMMIVWFDFCQVLQAGAADASTWHVGLSDRDHRTVCFRRLWHRLADLLGVSGAFVASQAMLGGGRALSSGSVRICVHACRPFQSGSRPGRNFSRGADHHYAQQIQRRVSAVQQATAVEAPPGLLTVPWDDTPEQQQVCLPNLWASRALHQSHRTEKRHEHQSCNILLCSCRLWQQ